MANSVFNLATLDGSNGFRLDGSTLSASGTSVSNAGDINGDGIDDLIIGATYSDLNGYSSGSSYVIFGNRDGFSSTLNLATLDGTNGFRLDGAINDGAGKVVSAAGDINGDGIDDVIIGAPQLLTVTTGYAYVVFGSRASFSPTIDLASLNGTDGFRLEGAEVGDIFGYSVSDAGDINGDGIDDVIVGSPGTTANLSYVIFGTQSGFGSSFDITTLDGTNGFRLSGSGSLGRSVSTAGDINGDGIDDLVIGATDNSLNYVVFGKQTGFSSTLDLSTLDGTDGFSLAGIAGDQLGKSATTAGDINGDGFDDLIIGAPGSSFNPGSSYIVFGKQGSFNPTLDLSTLDGTNGFRLDGAGASDFSGQSVSNAGDFNGDGLDDIIVGAFYAEQGAGSAYLIFGSRAGFSPSLNLANLDSSEGFRIAIDPIGTTRWVGYSVSAAGDINGDGLDDIVIGAPESSPNGITAAGSSFVIFGKRSLTEVSGAGGNKTLTISGDTIVTDFGGVGSDDKHLPSAAVLAEVDTLVFQGAGLTARNLLIAQDGNDLEINFEGTTAVNVTLRNVALENLDNLKQGIGNILFDGQVTVEDSYDIVDAAFTNGQVFKSNTVTFLNDLGNVVNGRESSNDVINGQGGDDRLNARSGSDLLRGEVGDDILYGGRGIDTLLGGEGDDIFDGGAGDDILTDAAGANRFVYETVRRFRTSDIGIDTITSFRGGLDKLVLDKTTFSSLTSAVGNGFSNSNEFAIVAQDAAARTSSAFIVYNSVNGKLFYNQNGSSSGLGQGAQFALLSGAPSLTATDFVVQA